MKLLLCALVTLLSGCTTMDTIYDESRWVYDGVHTATYSWEVTDTNTWCKPFAPNTRYWACALRAINAPAQPDAKPIPGAVVKDGHCFIYSNVTEEDAKRLASSTGGDLWSHEVFGHCRDGKRHP